MGIYNQFDQMVQWLGIYNKQAVVLAVALQQEPNIDHFTLENGSGIILLE